MKPYIFNLETTKIELHFEKSEYAALTADQKADLKSAFLWSRTGSCWVSRAKEPNLWWAKQVAAKLGFTEEQREGERLSFSEQVERQADRAERRAERYEQYAEKPDLKANLDVILAELDTAALVNTGFQERLLVYGLFYQLKLMFHPASDFLYRNWRTVKPLFLLAVLHGRQNFLIVDDVLFSGPCVLYPADYCWSCWKSGICTSAGKDVPPTAPGTTPEECTFQIGLLVCGQGGILGFPMRKKTGAVICNAWLGPVFIGSSQLLFYGGRT